MQIGGLAKRLSICGGKMVIGVSGGMDSTLSLLVAAQTLKKMGPESRCQPSARRTAHTKIP